MNNERTNTNYDAEANSHETSPIGFNKANLQKMGFKMKFGKLKKIDESSLLQVQTSPNPNKFVMRKNYCDKILKENDEKFYKKIKRLNLNDSELANEMSINKSQQVNLTTNVNQSYPDNELQISEENSEMRNEKTTTFHIDSLSELKEKQEKWKKKMAEDTLNFISNENVYKLHDILQQCEEISELEKEMSGKSENIITDYYARRDRYHENKNINRIINFDEYDYLNPSYTQLTTMTNVSQSGNAISNRKAKLLKKFRIAKIDKSSVQKRKFEIDTMNRINIFIKKPTIFEKNDTNSKEKMSLDNSDPMKMIKKMEEKATCIQTAFKKRIKKKENQEYEAKLEKMTTAWDDDKKNLISIYILKQEDNDISELLIKAYSTQNGKTLYKKAKISDIYEFSEKISYEFLNSELLIKLIKVSNDQIEVDNILSVNNLSIKVGGYQSPGDPAAPIKKVLFSSKEESQKVVSEQLSIEYQGELDHVENISAGSNNEDHFEEISTRTIHTSSINEEDDFKDEIN